MKKLFLILAMLVTLSLGLQAASETWKGVALVDGMCASKVKSDPDKHTTKCALQCQGSGYGLVTADGIFLKFDTAGNDKALAALKATKKADHLRATVTGEKDGDTIKVDSLSLD